MKVLVVGSGGREHAIIRKLSDSEIVDKIYCAPGNGGTLELAENVEIDSLDIDNLKKFSIDNSIDLTIVGPEDPLAKGIVDEFKKENLVVFGPDSKCAQLEASKDFCKKFLIDNGIPTAKYKTYYNYEEAIEGLNQFNYPLVIKADGLCLGKGVTICENEEEAVQNLKSIFIDKVFGSQGEKVVIEEYLDGIEASLMCFVSHNKIYPMESAKDYKKIYDDDLGPNTGGVGAYSPSPLFTDEFKIIIDDNIIRKIENGFEKYGFDYTGILFIGFMICNSTPYVLEFNVRFGDPETEVVLPRLKSDLAKIIIDAIEGKLIAESLIWDERPSVAVVLTSGGYPKEYVKEYEISGIEKVDNDVYVFHNGTKRVDGKLLTNGGRVLTIRCVDEMSKAIAKVYEEIKKINFNKMQYRKDIGKSFFL